MSELLFFLLGMMFGGFVALVTLCCLQINRIRKYEAEIRRLRKYRQYYRQSKEN